MIEQSALDGLVCDMVFQSDSADDNLTIATFYSAIRSQLEETIENLTDEHMEWKIHSCLEVKMSKGE